MKIYLASTAPGNEGGKGLLSLSIPKRLLSYHHIAHKILVSHIIFEAIKTKRRTNESK